MNQNALTALYSSIPGRYVHALFRVIEDQIIKNQGSIKGSAKLIDRILQEIELITRLLDKGAFFRMTLLRLFSGQFCPVWKDSFFQRLNFHSITLNFISIVVKNKRSHLLRDIARLFQLLIDTIFEKENLHVFTAYDVNLTDKQRVSSVLEKIFQRQISICFEVKKDLQDGILVHSDSLVIDASVKHQIERFKKQALSLVSIKGRET